MIDLYELDQKLNEMWAEATARGLARTHTSKIEDVRKVIPVLEHARERNNAA